MEVTGEAQGKTTPRVGKIVEDLAEPEISLRKHFFGQHAGFVDEKSGYGWIWGAKLLEVHLADVPGSWQLRWCQ